MSDDVEEPCSGTGSRSAGRDIHRAAAVVGRLRGLTVDDGLVVLHDHAALTGCRCTPSRWPYWPSGTRTGGRTVGCPQRRPTSLPTGPAASSCAGRPGRRRTCRSAGSGWRPRRSAAPGRRPRDARGSAAPDRRRPQDERQGRRVRRDPRLGLPSPVGPPWRRPRARRGAPRPGPQDARARCLVGDHPSRARTSLDHRAPVGINLDRRRGLRRRCCRNPAGPRVGRRAGRCRRRRSRGRAGCGVRPGRCPSGTTSPATGRDRSTVPAALDTSLLLRSG